MNFINKSSFVLLLILAACATGPATDDSLYRELGGEKGVEKLVTVAVKLAHADQRISFIFEEADDENLIEQLEDQICYLSGGPCTYEGLDMVEAHSGMEITEAEFDVFVELVTDAMEQTGIPHPARSKLLALLAPMREDIIYQ